MATELEELKQRHDALEEMVCQLEHRLTMDEHELNSIAQLGPTVTPPDAEGADGKLPAKQDKWLKSVDNMLRSIGLHQGLQENRLKDIEREVKRLSARQENFHEVDMPRRDGRLAAIGEGVERVERMITELVDRGTP